MGRGDDRLLCLAVLIEFSEQGLPLGNAIESVAKLECNRRIRRALMSFKEHSYSGVALVAALEASRLLPQRLPFNHLDLPVTAQLQLIHHYLTMRRNAIDDIWKMLRYPLLLVSCLCVSLAICWVWVLPSTIDLFSQTGHQLPFILRTLLHYQSAIQVTTCMVLALLVITFIVSIRRWFALSHRELLWAISCALSKGASLKQAITSISLRSPRTLKRQWAKFKTHMSDSPTFIAHWCQCFRLPVSESARCKLYTTHSASATRLDQLAFALMREHQNRLARTIQFMQPLIMVGIGAAILAIMFLNYVPLMTLINSG
ncbi:MAG: hypothetical protein O3A01_01100 [bacterium]|nr:hypothetical protein [bacterium]